MNTNTWPLEFTATPETSPKFVPGGSLGKSGTDSNGRSGTRSWANDGDVEISNSAQNTAFIDNLRFESIHADPFILFQFSFPLAYGRLRKHRFGAPQWLSDPVAQQSRLDFFHSAAEDSIPRRSKKWAQRIQRSRAGNC